MAPLRTFHLWLSSLGVGLLPGAQGTYASLLVAGLVALWLSLGGAPLSGAPYALLTGAVIALALWSSHMALRQRVFGGSPDPGQIVIDEAAGMLLAMWGITSLGWQLVAALVLFRIFDIVKPLGVGALQRLPGAWGVVADDLLAGLYALAVWRLLAWVPTLL
ncbi:MAG: phosphatidylglycerophosphatase A [Desulfarculaceae bacterium]|nr:phosphatidylglycerophosphatase A [Desulfarculaceae bacterium]MCF8072416.1 phosphatidylglycerophosphatase A [Desulfarculaceae bacterium]MCF8100337.1 phosphatidylglycerophosphatase A [Desulfarculaceae bacterium]MCF8117548.1 phosphatidylglycerophosphatase A [Desulfarculaceae bacterium]